MQVGDAVMFFQRMNFSEAVNLREMFVVPLVEVEPCVESLLILDELSRNDTYLAMYDHDVGFRRSAVALLQNMVDARWDYHGRPFFSGDDGFMNQGCRRDGGGFACYDNEKFLNDNAYAVALFSQVPDVKFTVGGGASVRRFADSADDAGFGDYFNVSAVVVPESSTTSLVAPSTTVRVVVPSTVPVVFPRQGGGGQGLLGLAVAVAVILVVIIVYRRVRGGGARLGRSA
jgi:hypothetical protein